MKFGTICAMPAEPVSTAVGDVDAYLVESRSVGGLSGSPVFVDVGLLRNVRNVGEYRNNEGPVPYLLGVVNAHWNAPAGSSTVEGDISTEMVNMGIAVVTPIDKILEVIAKSTYGQAIDALTEKATQTPLTAVDEQGRVHVEVRLDAPDGTTEPPGL